MLRTLPLLLLFVVLTISATGKSSFFEEKKCVTTLNNHNIIIETLVEKVGDLENFLSRIASKDISKAVRTLNINSAEKLFDDDATIQVSSKHRVTLDNPTGLVKTLLVGDYFRKLRDIDRYDHIKMEFEADRRKFTVYTSGRNQYRVEIEMKQSFKGFKNNQPLYFDVTTKRVDIVVSQEGKVLKKSDIKKIKFDGVIVLQTKDSWFFEE